MRALPGALAVVLLASLGLISTVVGHPSYTLVAIVWLCIGVAAWRPDDGLLVLAGLGPLGTAAAVAVGSPDWCMPMAMAVTAGAALGRIVRRETTADDAVGGVAAVWAVLVVTSLAVVIGVARTRTPSVTAFDALMVRWLTHTFPNSQALSFPGFWSALLALAGAGLFALTADRCARSPQLGERLTRLMALSMSGVGILSVYRLLEIALRRPPLLQALVAAIKSVRVSIVIGDVNAAGGLFLMMVPAAVCALFTPTRRLFGALVLPGLVAGLWLTGSRTALVLLPVAVIAAALSWPMRTRDTRRFALLATALLAIFVVVAASLWFSRVGSAPGTKMSFGVRREMGYVTAGMVQRHPVFGVGIGEFYSRSSEWMSPLLRGWYRAENAHNQFFQVLGELGLSGLAAFLALLWLGVWPALRAVVHTRTPSLVGPLAGVAAFVGTWFSSHQLLTAQSVIVFWILLGVTRAEGLRATAGRAAIGPWRPVRAAAFVAFAVAVAAMVPMRTEAVLAGMDLDGIAAGVSGWQTDPSTGRRFRTAEGSATVFVPGRVTRVTLPLRVRSAVGEVAIAVSVDGGSPLQVRPIADTWFSVPIPLPFNDRSRSHRVDVQVLPGKNATVRVDIGREEVVENSGTSP